MSNLFAFQVNYNYEVTKDLLSLPFCGKITAECNEGTRGPTVVVFRFAIKY